MEEKISGLHHITAIAGNAKQNLDFYTKVLGQRFVKKTVNFDDPVDVKCWAIVRQYKAQEITGSVSAGDHRVAIQAAQLKGAVPTTKDTLFISSTNPGTIVNVEYLYTGDKISEYVLTVRTARGR